MPPLPHPLPAPILGSGAGCQLSFRFAPYPWLFSQKNSPRPSASNASSLVLFRNVSIPAPCCLVNLTTDDLAVNGLGYAVAALGLVWLGLFAGVDIQNPAVVVAGAVVIAAANVVL